MRTVSRHGYNSSTPIGRGVSKKTSGSLAASGPGARIQRYFFNLVIGVIVFISNAYAQTGTAADSFLGGNLSSFLPLIVMFVAMYFLMIRPQQKRAKEQKAMMDALAKGDEVVTAGGILGKVAKVTDLYVTLELASGAEMVVQKNSVTMQLPKGTLKSL